MLEVVMQALNYILTMFLGYFLKRVGVLRKSDRDVLANLIFYVTLPATLVLGYEEVAVSYWFMISLLIGLTCNGIALALGYLAGRKKPPKLRALYVINTPGYNLGNIAIPYLQAFFPTGIPYLCMFDIGDSLYTLGGTDALARNIAGEPARLSAQLRKIVSALLHSVPFLTCIIMTLISLLQISLPQPFFSFCGYLARANGALVMLMVGVSLEFQVSKSDWRDILTILAIRYLSAAVFALVIYYVLPAPLVMRQVLALGVFSAVPNICLIFSNRIDSESTVASALNPISLLLSIPLMSAIILLMLR